MMIIEKAFQGDIAGVNQLLDKDPTQLNAQKKYTILGDKEVTLTPLFAAAVTGRLDLVKNLVDRGASLSSEEEGDLFTWTCLCPDRKARGAILDDLLVEGKLERIHPELTMAHAMAAKGVGGNFPKPTEYPLNFVQTSILSGTLCECCYAAELVPYRSFQGMNPLELKTYRIAIFQMLKNQGFFVPKPTPAYEIYEAAAIGDLETLKSYSKALLFTCLEEGVFKKDWRLIVAAAMTGQIEVLRYLREECGILNFPVITGPRAGWLPAHFAASCGQVEVLKYLRDECGIDLDCSLGLVDLAAEYGQVEVLRYLREECGIDLNRPQREGNQAGWRPVDIAVLYGHIGVLKYLREECGIDLNIPTETGPPSWLEASQFFCDNRKIRSLKVFARGV